MSYKVILRRLWRKNPVGVLSGMYNIAVLYVNSFLRFGNWLARPISKMALKQAEIDTPISEIYPIASRAVDLSSRIFSVVDLTDIGKLYPMLRNVETHVVEDVRVVFGINNDGDAQIIVRGSANIENWVDNIDADLEWDDKIHSMVHDGYREIGIAISNIFKQYLTDNPDIRRVDVMGYSMGGALAILTALYLVEEGVSIDEVISVAGPKFVQLDYGRLDVLHVIHEQDPVPYMPIWGFFTPYRHQGRRLLVRKDGSLTLLRNSNATDIFLSPSLLRSSLDPSVHLDYPKHFNRREREYE